MAMTDVVQGRAGSRPARPSLVEALAHFGELSPEALGREWQRVHRGAAPACLSPDLLRRELAYRLQEHALGGLAPAHRRHLASLARDQGSRSRWNTAPLPHLRPGTTLVREWHGRTHTVLVLEGGFDCGGQRYASLSQVAQAITGVHWSGPRFFGLRRSGAGKPGGAGDG